MRFTRSIVAFLFFALPGLTRADLVNIAQVSFLDGQGVLRQNASNRVQVVVEIPPPPPANLETIEGRTFRPDAAIRIPYAATFTEMEWSFEPLTPAGGQTTSNATGSLPTLARTPAAALRLSELSINSGRYRMGVRVWNGSKDSPWRYATMTVGVASLQSVKVYPNPWRLNDHADLPIVFSGLPQDSTLKIYSVSGEAVFKATPSEVDYSWNRRNSHGEEVSSGIYLYLVESLGQRVRGKFVIIR